MIPQKKKIHKPKRRTVGHIYGGWIQYQLSLVNVSNTDIAAELGVGNKSVWNTIHGVITSARIRQAIADKLQMRDWNAVMEAAQKATKENVV